MAKFLLLGLGSAGRRHMELLASLRPAAHILTAHGEVVLVQFWEI